MKRLFLLFLVLMVFVVGTIWAGEFGYGPFVINREGEKKLIIRHIEVPFTEAMRAIDNPGWALRIPGITSVYTFDARVHYLNRPPLKVYAKPPANDPLIIDYYVVWRIQDPVAFYESFRATAGSFAEIVPAAERRIGDEVLANVGGQVARHSLAEVLTDKRVELMGEITRRSQKSVSDWGVHIVDVRINRTNHPTEVRKNVYKRMRTDREQVAAMFRAQGLADAEAIRAKADSDFRRTLAEAGKQAVVKRGEADAQAAIIYSEAYDQDREFFAFMRSLEAYRKAVDEESTIVISPDSDFFEYFGSLEGR